MHHPKYNKNLTLSRKPKFFCLEDFSMAKTKVAKIAEIKPSPHNHSKLNKLDI